MSRHKSLLWAVVLLAAMVMPFSVFAGSQSETGASGEEVVDLIWIMGGTPQLDVTMVEEVLNEISIKEVGATNTTLVYDNERTQLALASGEDWDMVFTCEWFNNFAVQARAGYYADITGLLKSSTPELYKIMPEIVWEGAKIDGKIMAIPVKKDYAAEIFFRFDKELYVEKLGMNPPQLPDDMTFADVEMYLEAGKKAFEDGLVGPEGEYPLTLNGGIAGINGHFDHINRDAMIAIPYSAVGTRDSDKIVFLYEHEDMMERLQLANKWFKAGYINRDAATRTDAVQYSPIKIGQGFYGADAIWTGADGYVQTISRWSGPFLSTSSIRGSMNAINADSDNIEVALKFQELVNTNVEYRDILRYGVEGTHWDRTDNGLIMQNDTGRNRYRPWPFSQGSYSLSTVEAAVGVDVDPDMWKVIFDGYQDLKATNTIGFSFDITPVESEVAALKFIRDKYEKVLTTGTVDPNVEVPKLIEEAEAAGIRNVIKEAQAQFDAFLAGK